MNNKAIAAAIGITAEALTGCAPMAQGYTTPFGIVYTEENPPEWVVKHEQCHWERAQKEGLAFWVQYDIDPQFRCDEERRCGAPNHEFCKGVKK